MTSVTLNGNTYNDGITPPRNMGNGGHRENLLPMLSDAVAELAAKAALATTNGAAQVTLAQQQVALATAQAALAATNGAAQVTLAQQQAAAAAASAAAADDAANAPMWVSGTNYVVGNRVWSPITVKTYRRKTNGTGAADPSLDGANWVSVSDSAVKLDILALVGNVALGSATGRALSIGSATGAYAIAMPDATTLASNGGNLFYAVNGSGYAQVITTKNGIILGRIDPGETLVLLCVNDTTADGAWRMVIGGGAAFGLVPYLVNDYALPQYDFGFSKHTADGNANFMLAWKGASNYLRVRNVTYNSDVSYTLGTDTALTAVAVTSVFLVPLDPATAATMVLWNQTITPQARAVSGTEPLTLGTTRAGTATKYGRAACRGNSTTAVLATLDASSGAGMLGLRAVTAAGWGTHLDVASSQSWCGLIPFEDNSIGLLYSSGLQFYTLTGTDLATNGVLLTFAGGLPYPDWDSIGRDCVSSAGLGNSKVMLAYPMASGSSLRMVGVYVFNFATRQVASNVVSIPAKNGAAKLALIGTNKVLATYEGADGLLYSRVLTYDGATLKASNESAVVNTPISSGIGYGVARYAANRVLALAGSPAGSGYGAVNMIYATGG